MKTVLTIAGYDPSSGAGVTADLMVFAAHGLFGTSCITALTVQSTLGVRSTYPVDAGIVNETLQWLDEDLRPDGVKIGMISTENNCLETVRYINRLKQSHRITSRPAGIPIVLDPVLKSTSGLELVDSRGLVTLQEELLPAVDWITPNVEELSFLSGVGVTGLADVPPACQRLREITAKKRYRGQLGILAKGGHLHQPDDYLLTPEGQGFWLSGDRVQSAATHGTGCALSSAFMCQLVLGQVPFEAAKRAKAYVAGAMRNATTIGKGNGPLNHLWQLHKVED